MVLKRGGEAAGRAGEEMAREACKMFPLVVHTVQTFNNNHLVLSLRDSRNLQPAVFIQ